MLGTGTSVGRASATVFICPEGETAIIKGILVGNRSASSTDAWFDLQRPGVSVVRMWFRAAIASSAAVTSQEWVVLEHDDRLYFGSSVTGIEYWVSGARLPG